MHATGKAVKRVPRSLLVGAIVVLAAVSFTAAYSRRATEARDDALATPHATLAGDTRAVLPASAQAATSRAPQMVVTFRLDPAVTRGLYLGDRWVSPPTLHFAQPGTQYVVHAKLQSIDAQDESVDLSGDWSTDDPDMIAIERHPYGEVTIVVRRAGEGRMFVSAGGVTKELHVRARQTADAMDVAISQ
jgi:hypothetical protein